jgi:hypothetical protein
VRKIARVRLTNGVEVTAEFGFFGVVVVTFVHTPRLNGALKAIGLFFKVLKPLLNIAERDGRLALLRPFLIN